MRVRVARALLPLALLWLFRFANVCDFRAPLISSALFARFRLAARLCPMVVCLSCCSAGAFSFSDSLPPSAGALGDGAAGELMAAGAFCDRASRKGGRLYRVLLYSPHGALRQSAMAQTITVDREFADRLCEDLGGPAVAPSFGKMLDAAARLARKRAATVEGPQQTVTATRTQILANLSTTRYQRPVTEGMDKLRRFGEFLCFCAGPFLFSSTLLAHARTRRTLSRGHRQKLYVPVHRPA